MGHRFVIILGLLASFSLGVYYGQQRSKPLVVTPANDSISISRVELDHLSLALSSMGSSLNLGPGSSVYKENGESGGVKVRCSNSDSCVIKFPEEAPKPLQAKRRFIETKDAKVQSAPSGKAPEPIQGEVVTSFDEMLFRLRHSLREGDKLREVVVLRGGKRIRIRIR